MNWLIQNAGDLEHYPTGLKTGNSQGNVVLEEVPCDAKGVKEAMC